MTEEMNLKIEDRKLPDNINNYSDRSGKSNLLSDDAKVFEGYSFKERLAILKKKISELSSKISG